MGNLRESIIWRFFLSLSLFAVLIMACDDLEERPSFDTVTLSGRVVDLILMAMNLPPSVSVIAGATVAMEDVEKYGNLSCVTDEHGFWSIEVDNDGSDPFIKVTKEGVLAPSYFQIPAGTTGMTAMEVPVLLDAFYDLVFQFAGGDPAFIDNSCVIIGPVAGFTNPVFPQEYDMIKEIMLEVSPNDPPVWEGPNEEIRITYWDELESPLLYRQLMVALVNRLAPEESVDLDDFDIIPLPNQDLTETVAGLWSIVVPDATQVNTISVMVVDEEGNWKEGWLHAHEQPTRPGGFITAGTLYLPYESPCIPDPCRFIGHAEADDCSPVGTDGDFMCDCEQGYVWDEDNNRCVL